MMSAEDITPRCFKCEKRGFPDHAEHIRTDHRTEFPDLFDKTGKMNMARYKKSKCKMPVPVTTFGNFEGVCGWTDNSKNFSSTKQHAKEHADKGDANIFQYSNKKMVHSGVTEHKYMLEWGCWVCGERVQAGCGQRPQNSKTGNVLINAVSIAMRKHFVDKNHLGNHLGVLYPMPYRYTMLQKVKVLVPWSMNKEWNPSMVPIFIEAVTPSQAYFDEMWKCKSMMHMKTSNKK